LAAGKPDYVSDSGCLKSTGEKKSRDKSFMRKRSTTKSTGRRKASKRELINTGRDKRFVRRNSRGEFKESDDVGRSLAADRRKKAKTKVKSGQGDRGDR